MRESSFLRRASSSATGFEAPSWFAYGWANVKRKEPAPTLESTKDKVVVIHAFQSW